MLQSESEYNPTQFCSHLEEGFKGWIRNFIPAKFCMFFANLSLCTVKRFYWPFGDENEAYAQRNVLYIP